MTSSDGLACLTIARCGKDIWKLISKKFLSVWNAMTYIQSTFMSKHWAYSATLGLFKIVWCGSGVKSKFSPLDWQRLWAKLTCFTSSLVWILWTKGNRKIRFCSSWYLRTFKTTFPSSSILTFKCFKLKHVVTWPFYKTCLLFLDLKWRTQSKGFFMPQQFFFFFFLFIAICS